MQVSPVQAETLSSHGLHDRPERQPDLYAYISRRPLELPLPLEPRAASASSIPLRPSDDPRRDIFHKSIAAPRPDRLPAAPILPPLHDVLTSNHRAPPYNARNQSWTTAPGSPRPANGGIALDTFGHQPRWSSAQRVELPSLEVTTAHTQPGLPAAASPPFPHPVERPGTNQSMRHDSVYQLPRESYLGNGRNVSHPGPGFEEKPYLHQSALSKDHPPPAANSHPSQTVHDPPRGFLCTREVPGEGVFHFYSDGSRIPAHVDGETVNPVWGLTKANKPRKRLAMACLDCREKKIKCEPGVNSCVQCEKGKRICRKSQNPPGTADNVAVAWSAAALSPSRRSTSDLARPPTRDERFDHDSKRRDRDEHLPPGNMSKKHRSTSPSASSDRVSLLSVPLGHKTVASTASCQLLRYPGADIDPFARDPAAVDRAIDVFLTYINGSEYRIFPHSHFSQWIRTSRVKSPDEAMVLHAVLAVGTILDKESLAGFGASHADAATEAFRRLETRPSFATVQTQFFLAVYTLATRGQRAASHHFTSAVNGALYLNLNTERGCETMDGATDTPGPDRHDFGLSKTQLVECKRRVLWSCFLFDRLHGGPVGLVNQEDIFLRLPCADETYEQSRTTTAPWFQNPVTDPVASALRSNSAVSSMAWLISVTAVWAKVQSFMHRSAHWAVPSYPAAYEKFYSETHAAMQEWSDQLPSELHFSPENLQQATSGRFIGPLASMHILHHLCLLKLNRCMKHAQMRSSVPRNIRAAQRHAYTILQIINNLHTAHTDVSSYAAPLPTSLPLAGRAALAAVDVVGAGESEAHIHTARDSIWSALGFLNALRAGWADANHQTRLCEKRFYELKNVIERPNRGSHSGVWIGREWGLELPLERDLAEADDCIYGLPGLDYFHILRADAAGFATGTDAPALSARTVPGS